MRPTRLKGFPEGEASEAMAWPSSGPELSAPGHATSALGTTDGALGTLSDCLPFKHEPGQSSLCVAPSRYLVILRRKLTQPASFLFKKGVDGHSLCFYSFLWDGNFSETSEQKETAIKQWRLANSY